MLGEPGSYADNLGRLDCGCRVSTVVSGTERPYGCVRFCKLHARAGDLALAAAELVDALEYHAPFTPAAANAIGRVRFLLGKFRSLSSAGPGRGDPL